MSAPAMQQLDIAIGPFWCHESFTTKTKTRKELAWLCLHSSEKELYSDYFIDESHQVPHFVVDEGNIEETVIDAKRVTCYLIQMNESLNSLTHSR
eukprot:scaffold4441_cov145-Skeletonema_menzelii.AAC.7